MVGLVKNVAVSLTAGGRSLRLGLALSVSSNQKSIPARPPGLFDNINRLARIIKKMPFAHTDGLMTAGQLFNP